jgi:hypothetical protein
MPRWRNYRCMRRLDHDTPMMAEHLPRQSCAGWSVIVVGRDHHGEAQDVHSRCACRNKRCHIEVGAPAKQDRGSAVVRNMSRRPRTATSTWYLDPWSPLGSKYTGEHRNRREENERGIPMRPSLTQKKGFATAILRSANAWHCKPSCGRWCGRFCLTEVSFLHDGLTWTNCAVRAMMTAVGHAALYSSGVSARGARWRLSTARWRRRRFPLP